MAIDTTAEELREVAQFVEQAGSDAIFAYSDIEFSLIPGDLKVFPRPTAEDQAAQQGFEVLRRKIEEAAAELYALATALDRGFDVPPILLAFTQPYIDAYRREQRADASQ
jgi:hypothetical protein